VRPLILFWLALWYLAWTQVLALLGFYAPVLIILTPSDMPYLPPLSIIFFVPGELPRDGGAYPVVDYAPLWGPLKAPVVHYAAYDNGKCVYIIPNAKATADRYLTWMAPINYIADLLPPYPSLTLQSECRWASYGAFSIPGYAVFLLQIAILMAPKYYYKFRRVF